MIRFLSCLFCLVFWFGLSQEKQSSGFTDINYFQGYIPLHNPDILHLIKGRPEGTLIAWNRRTNGEKQWQRRYNYPDYGVSFMVQDLKNDVLGNTLGLYGHFNFYFFKRRMMLRVGQGVMLSTNPYDKNSNPKNIAFGSQLLVSPYIMLNYRKSNLIGPLGFQSGLIFFHASNGNFKAPNTSINTISLNFGLNYDLDAKQMIYNKPLEEYETPQDFNFNLVLRLSLIHI